MNGDPRNEPVLIAAMVRATLGLIVIMEWARLTEQQIGAIIIFAEVVLTPLLRYLVAPVKLVKERLDTARSLGIHDSDPTVKVPDAVKV